MSYPPYLNPFGSDAGSRGPGSEQDHPGGSLYASLPPASSTASSSVGQYDDDFLPPPPADWLAPVMAPMAAPRPTPNVVLPPFKVKRPAAWFVQCEDLFRMRGVTDQRDQFALCYNALGDEQQEQVDDIAEMRPRPPDAFNRMRDRLVASHSLDAYQRLEQLLALPALGGQRPSALLAQMRQLCPPREEDTLFFRAAFLQRLPAPIRLALAEDKYSPVSALAARADTLIAHHNYGGVAAVSQPAPDEPAPDMAAAVADRRQRDAQSKKKKGGKAPLSGRGSAASGKEDPWVLLGICKRHYDYGKECFKCADPSSCRWSSGN